VRGGSPAKKFFVIGYFPLRIFIVFLSSLIPYNSQMYAISKLEPAPHNRNRDGAPPPGIFRLFAIGELVGYKPCAILAASWWVSGDGQCRDETQ
jgi:hypothetical protein